VVGRRAGDPGVKRGYVNDPYATRQHLCLDDVTPWWLRGVLAANLAETFYEHPLIRGLARKGSKDRLPSYIPGHTFTLVVWDIVSPRIEVEKATKTRAKATEEETPFRGVADPDLKWTLTALWTAAEGKVEDMRTGLEGWFNDAMDRVSGWYRRHIQLVLAAITVVVVGMLNADTVRMASVLWTNPTVRAAVVAQAEETVKGKEGETGTQEMVEETVKDLQTFPLPLGWSTKTEDLTDPRRVPTTFAQVLIKALGLVLTVVAPTLGAPFWFDFLKRFDGIRAAGAPPMSERLPS
jgi:hypothetical protein